MSSKITDGYTIPPPLETEIPCDKNLSRTGAHRSRTGAACAWRRALNGRTHWGSYLDVILQLLPPLLRGFGPQMGVPFAREIRSLNDLPELHGPKDTTRTFKSKCNEPSTTRGCWLKLNSAKCAGTKLKSQLNDLFTLFSNFPYCNTRLQFFSIKQTLNFLISL